MKSSKSINTILLFNIVILSLSIIVTTTIIKIKTSASTDQDNVVDMLDLTVGGTKHKDLPIDYQVSQWKVAGHTGEPDLAHDFRNGLGGDLSIDADGQLLEGESIWIYSKKLRELLIETNQAQNGAYNQHDEEMKGYVAIINRVNRAKITSPNLLKAFPRRLGGYRINIVSPSKIDLLHNDEASKIFYESRQSAEKLFASVR